jgi:hypothetical protein
MRRKRKWLDSPTFNDYIFGSEGKPIPTILDDLWDKYLDNLDEKLLRMAQNLPEVPLYQYMARKREESPEIPYF